MNAKLRSEEFAPARILGIETSCDETAAAVVENGRIVQSNVIASQAEIHARYGGVFPEVASREHIRIIYAVIDEALQKAHISLKDVDAVAVTRGPGLAGSLVVGLNAAKGLALAGNLPIIGVNHLEGHLYSAWLETGKETGKDEPEFPLVALLVSGGHTELIRMENHLKYELLGRTQDDAAGEAFDKVARLLNLPYPGGPSIQKEAVNGKQDAFSFPRAKVDGAYNFSFSGLKTAVMREVRALEIGHKTINTADLAASFQAAVVDVLVHRTLQAAEDSGAKSIVLAGGVSANQALRESLAQVSSVPVFIPDFKYCTDNAAMIAGAGYFRYSLGEKGQLDMDAEPNWSISAVAV